MKEIEILVEVYGKIEDVKKELAKYKIVGEKETVDTYYYDPLRENLQPNKDLQLNECLRLRTKGKEKSVTYKVDNFDETGKWIYSDEYETVIESLEMTREILEKLGLKKLIKISNNKTIYMSENYEIALEIVEGLGVFLEVEYCTEKDVDVMQIKRDIQEFIDNLNFDVSEELNMGKPEMMLRKEKNK